MTNFASRSDLKNMAKDKMTGRYFYAIILLFSSGALTLFLTDSGNLIETSISNSLHKLLGLESTNLYVIGICSLVSFFFSIMCEIFQIGIALFYLSAACGQPNTPGNLFWGFHDNFKRSFILAGVSTAISTICSIPFQLVRFQFNATKNISMDLLIPCAIAQLVLIVVYLYAALSLSQCYFLVLDFPQYDAWQIIKLSHKIMSGHKLRFLLLEISFFPLILLTIPTFGIGVLWLSPYMYMTYAVFFLDLMQNKEN